MVFFSSCRLSPNVCSTVLIIARNQLGKQLVPDVKLQVRNVSTKTMRHRVVSEPKPAPFPYKDKRYNFWRALFDSTEDRLDENSKLIVVEGLPAAGKHQLAKGLADELDMVYFPSPTQAETFINDYGFNLKTLDPQLPESCQSYDETDFLKDPTRMSGLKAGRFQLMKYQLRFQRHMDALAHILNTGQGVVMDRSPYSDFVYITAMAEQGIVSKRIEQFYHKVRDNSLLTLWKPHLVIYLDVPVPEIRRRIETRNRPHEKDSIATSQAYLESLDKAYKNIFLKDISVHSEVMVYDWTEGGDSEIVAEDVERIDFDQYTPLDKKLEDWRRIDKWDWNAHRYTFTHDQNQLYLHTCYPGTSCPEIVIAPEEYRVYERIISNAPGNKYEKGFNADMGDKGLLFKL
nr:EOG090X05NZ [Ilyocryptus agilis]